VLSSLLFYRVRHFSENNVKLTRETTVIFVPVSSFDRPHSRGKLEYFQQRRCNISLYDGMKELD